MNKVIIVVAGVILLGLAIFFLSKPNRPNGDNTPKTDEMITYFYGDTCPHCKELEEFIDKNDIKNKLPLEEKEVFENQANGRELAKAAQSCGINTDSIGVPLLYAEGKCIFGTPDSIAYLSRRIGLEIPPEASSAAQQP